MTAKLRYPILPLKKFNCSTHHSNFYVNTFREHLITNSFVELPHSHEFYLLVCFTKGNGIHQIDFDSYPITRGALFFLQPGQIHNWTLSEDTDGYIVFFTQEQYHLYFRNKSITDYAFYNSPLSTPELQLDDPQMIRLRTYFELLLEEYAHTGTNKNELLLNLLDSIHLEISRIYVGQKNHLGPNYGLKIDQFKAVLHQHYIQEKSSRFYANELNITQKHLNRICKNVLNLTSTEVITNKIILESKRMLVSSTKSIAEIADSLGYENYSYFAKVFKKSAGMSPKDFRKAVKYDF